MQWLRDFIRKSKERCKKLLSLGLIYLFNCLPIKNNKLFFFSYYGAQYGCSPKYITEYILNHYPQGEFDLVWAFNDLQAKNELYNIRKVKTMSLKYFYELCTSKVVITNFRTTDLFIKRKNQFYIQTWHSSLRLKQIEKDAEDDLPAHYVQMAKKDSLKCDLLLSGCNYSTKIFKRAFWYDGEILESGTPRNDLLLQDNQKIKDKLFQKLQLPSNSKVILYAPTFRKDNKLDAYNLDYERVLQKLENRFGGNWTFLVKLHPHLSSKSSELVSGKNVIDVSAFDDIQELLSISDILISDYSSLIFDFALTNRPCFLYVPDLDDYIKNERKLYFNLMELPFVAATSTQELLHKIEGIDFDSYNENLSDFLVRVGSYEDGKACKNLLSRIQAVCFNKNGGDVHEAV